MADLLIKKIQVGTQAYSIYDERVKVAEVPAGAKFTDTTYTGTQGITVSGTNIKHSNAVTAVDTQGLLKISYDAYGHITGSTAVTKADITGLGIPDSDTTYGAEKGISLSGGKFGHSNSAITAATSAVFKKFKYDEYGHIIGVANVAKSDITGLGIPAQDTTYTGTQGIELSGTTFKHSNSIGAQGTQGLYKISWDAQGHITGVTAVAKADITALGIPGSNTTYSAEKGISLSNGKFGHSNTAITAATSAVFKKIKYDAYGHITGVANVESSDITPLISGATADITELQTLVNKIKAELEDPSSDGLTSVLETMQNILNSSANAVTGITYAKQTLSVDANGVLSISDGSVTPTTAAFVTANTTVTPVPAGTND